MTTQEQEAAAKTTRQTGRKPQKDLSHIKCFACNKMGHYTNKCPKKKEQEEEDEDEAEVHSTWHEEQEGAMYMTNGQLVGRRRHDEQRLS